MPNSFGFDLGDEWPGRGDSDGLSTPIAYVEKLRQHEISQAHVDGREMGYPHGLIIFAI